MRELTPEIRAELVAKYGPDLQTITSTVDLEDGTETVSIVVRAPQKLADYDAAIDAQARPKEKFEAVVNLMTSCCVWPSASEIGAVLDLVPDIADVAFSAIDKLSGGGKDAIDGLRPGGLATLTPEEMAKAGISDEQVKTWRASHRRGLVVFRTQLGLWICKRPGFSEYATWRRARETGAMSSGLRGLAAECAVFPAGDAIAAQLERLPTLAIAAGAKLAEMAEKARATAGGM